MDQLIPIMTQQVAEDTLQTVDARGLHAFLEVGKDFTTWIRDRIRQYGFVEGQIGMRFKWTGLGILLLTAKEPTIMAEWQMRLPIKFSAPTFLII